MPQPVPGKRRTSQRETIAQVIVSADGPLTVEQIHARARRQIPALGIATVYRTVKLLTEADRISTVVLPDGQSRYEPADLDHHHHFRCRRCDRVFDLPGCMLSISEPAQLPGGFVVDGHEITLFGTCPDCAAKKPKRKSKSVR